jgi:hypothetical protein
MTRLQALPPILAALVIVLIGTALAGERRGTKVLPTAIDTTTIPEHCHPYLRVPVDSTSVTMPWDQRLSLAACRQYAAITPTGNRAEYPDLIARIDRLMDPSIAMYQDALARGPTPGVRILAAYGLGMTYRNSIVRAHGAVLVPESTTYGGNAYGAYAQFHHPLELLLGRHRAAARAAFDEVLRLAGQYPDAARANTVMVFVVDDARSELASLEAAPETWPNVSLY